MTCSYLAPLLKSWNVLSSVMKGDPFHTEVLAALVQQKLLPPDCSITAALAAVAKAQASDGSIATAWRVALYGAAQPQCGPYEAPTAGAFSAALLYCSMPTAAGGASLWTPEVVCCCCYRSFSINFVVVAVSYSLLLVNCA